jgi:hypothetical protein
MVVGREEETLRAAGRMVVGQEEERHLVARRLGAADGRGKRDTL